MCAHDDSTAGSTAGSPAATSPQNPTARGATCPVCGGSGRLPSTDGPCGACDSSGHASLEVAHGYVTTDLRAIRAALAGAINQEDDADDLLYAANRLAAGALALTGQALGDPGADDAAESVLRESVQSLDGDLGALDAVIWAANGGDTSVIGAAELIALSLFERADAAEGKAAKLHQAAARQATKSDPNKVEAERLRRAAADRAATIDARIGGMLRADAKRTAALVEKAVQLRQSAAEQVQAAETEAARLLDEA